MRIFLIFSFVLMSPLLFSQNKEAKELQINSVYNKSDSIKKKVTKVATIDMYRFITLEKDTTYIDTSLTIQKEYSHNFLRKDNFGLLPFANDGQTYNTLQYSLTDFSPYPEFGFKSKQFNFIKANQIRYSSVATPLTELYFKTVSEQGQSIDAFFTMNTSPRFNFSIAYKGLRSLGKYINQLSSSGNFRLTISYNTKNKRYFANAHYTSQDFLNGENGGITTPSSFENGDVDFTKRARFEVYLTDAKSFLRAERLFLDHNFRINPKKGNNNLYATHQFNYERKFFEYNELTPKIIPVENSGVYRFGDAIVSNTINDQTN